ncbi:MAG: hypothetical protein HY736_00385 [Verrucomicrobia bacterium]|nr:hypothetical protein [Verrucomicrobiota bacterium]
MSTPRYPVRPLKWHTKLLGAFGFSFAAADRKFLEEYTTLLLGQYRSLPQPPRDPLAQKDADEVVALIEKTSPAGTAPLQLEWADLYRLELALIKLEAEPLLQRRAWILRNEYAEVASDQEKSDYKDSKPPTAEPQTPPQWDALRADLVRLQEELNWRYVSLWTLESFRGRLMRGVVCAGLLAVVFYGVVIAGTASALNLNGTLLWMIAGAGILGALASTMRRVQQAELGGNTDLEMAGLNQGNLGVFLSPALGGLFAFVLTAIFASGLMSGGAFPKLSSDLFWGSFDGESVGTQEVAKLLVWSFISGFSERFVPDKLAKLAADAA